MEDSELWMCEMTDFLANGKLEALLKWRRVTSQMFCVTPDELKRNCPKVLSPASSYSVKRGWLLLILFYTLVNVVEKTTACIWKPCTVQLNCSKTITATKCGCEMEPEPPTHVQCFVSSLNEHKIILCSLAYISHLGRKSKANYWQTPKELMKLFITMYFCRCHKAWCVSQGKSHPCINNQSYCSTFINSASAY